MGNKQSSKQDEVIIRGVPASPGIVIGKAYIHRRKTPEIKSVRISEQQVREELQLFRDAREKLKRQWQQLHQKENDKHSKSILAAQLTIIDDPDLSSRIEHFIEQEWYGAQQAVSEAFKEYMDRLSRAGNSMMTDRMIDLSDIRDRLLEAAGTKTIPGFSVKGEILVSEEVSPREVIELSHQNIKGLIMERGGNTSHTAIIARSVGLPAVVGAKGIIEQLSDEVIICLDGEQGLVSINPSAHTRKRVEMLKHNKLQSEEDQLRICKKPSQTLDGRPFILRANVEFTEELKNVRKFRAEGIGLLRTESVYLNQEQFGSTENQSVFYGEMLAETKNHPVTIRLFDVGGDKFQESKITESNPFLGWRGIRMLLDERSVLREQLNAILKVSGQHPGRIRLLVPMVSTLDEIKELKDEIAWCRRQLTDEGHQVDGSIPLGMMVEIPSTAVNARYFAAEVDFFSIGTNDLTQYMLAVDRGNALISKLYNQAHPAMWTLIAQIIGAADEYQIEVDVCGELAANPVAAACLIGMGVSSLSMSPSQISKVKRLLVNSSSEQIEHLAEQVQQCTSTREVESLFNHWKMNVNDA